MTTIITKNSSTTGAAPTSGDLVQGELAVNVTDTGLYTENASGTVVKLNAPSIDDKNTGATKYVTIASGGNVGIGTSSPSFTFGKGLMVENAGYATVRLNNTSNTVNSEITSYATGLFAYTITNHPIVFGTNGTEKMRIDSSGNLLVGKTTSGNTVVGFEVNPTGAVFSTIASSTNSNSTSHVYSSTAGAYRFYVGMGGTVYATSTSITAISDESLKENIRGLETGLSEILSLKPRRFDWKENTGIDQKNVAGFIAQEFEKVFPDLVYEYQYNETETKKSIKMGDILPTIVKAIQEQQAIINAQQATLTTLTARIEALENK
jgi:hypothetical protein